eukprot:7689791-Lingulodinium_polyedra.AAC.1
MHVVACDRMPASARHAARAYASHIRGAAGKGRAQMVTSDKAITVLLVPPCRHTRALSRNLCGLRNLPPDASRFEHLPQGLMQDKGIFRNAAAMLLD